MEPNIKDTFCFIDEAARLLKMNTVTLRRWSNKGKFPSYRHPVNGYRMYKRSDLEEFIKKINESTQDVREKL